jgi:hypothetical protein
MTGTAPATPTAPPKQNLRPEHTLGTASSSRRLRRAWHELCHGLYVRPRGGADSQPQVKAVVQGEPACKPASVPRASPGWRPSIWDRRCRRPRAVHQGTRPGQPPRPRRRGRYVPDSTLLRVGFTEPTGHPAAGALLPHPFTLTADLTGPYGPGGGRRRFAFCGTVLRVAPTGGWPAPCPVETGLSSIPSDRDRGRPADSPCDASMPPNSAAVAAYWKAWFPFSPSPSSSSRWPSWR